MRSFGRAPYLFEEKDEEKAYLPDAHELRSGRIFPLLDPFRHPARSLWHGILLVHHRDIRCACGTRYVLFSGRRPGPSLHVRAGFPLFAVSALGPGIHTQALVQLVPDVVFLFNDDFCARVGKIALNLL